MTISLSPDEPKLQPQGSTCYSSKYLADYYDLHIEDWNDAGLYGDKLDTMISQVSPPVTVFDIGTGSGRVIHSLLAAKPRANVRFLGLDIEPHMLERARQLTDPSVADQIDWLLGSADNLESLPVFQNGPPFVDMITFACGSICHLHQPGQGERFFQQIAKVLKPGTGRAYVSVLNMLTDGGEAQAQALRPPFGNDPVASKVLPGILYRETWPRHELIDKVWHTARHIVAFRLLPGGEEQVVEYNVSEREARVWTEADLRAAAKIAGLQLVEKIVQENETGLPETIFVWGVDV
ncbi:S-adenosyl-L-methionine-dependent methyltransferase [Aspergillus uvarum CBS 121591]|uniref:S-adenosyl-L-methionine-dependent methyltransferase n=1 Tax=Aspergillus uvarum CBS 121591 TaxID=1448315 RepID=A0A319CQM0_9EURO|nr:S-adenosyl-L-methionine-dependent methyltransferase [Aspergillus uvarum CBS 121591]PYH85267.1 S-adenosyl-L-methionine-dependent methyltransferase [Aspergillus uvarum CBS 121591]